MKLTKSQLKEIIREELLKEATPSGQHGGTKILNMFDKWYDLSEKLIKALKTYDKKDDFEYNINLSIKSNFDNNDIYNIKSEVKKWFGKFNIFGLYKHEYYNEKQDFQFKVGLGVKLWN